MEINLPQELFFQIFPCPLPLSADKYNLKAQQLITYGILYRSNDGLFPQFKSTLWHIYKHSLNILIIAVSLKNNWPQKWVPGTLENGLKRKWASANVVKHTSLSL